jgi:nucleoside-diphosphate-sugar epimerase
MSTVLVTGGRGFLGTHLVTELKRMGEEVRVLARKTRADEGQIKSKIHLVQGDIRDQQVVNQAVQGVDHVIHLVSNFRRGGSDKKEAHSINVEGTENILWACHKYGVKQLIHCSTIGVHGNVREIPANEETPFNPGDLYQETKLLAEKRVWEFHEKTNFPITIIRPISLFGPGDLRMLKLFRLIKKGRFVVVGNGKPLFQPAYIDDVIQGFILCLNNNKAIGEAFIIGGEEYVTLNELFSMIAEELGVSPPKSRIPLTPVIWLSTLCEKVCVPLGIEPPIHKRRVSFFQNNRAFSIEKAKTMIDYQPQVSLRQGIRRTIRWYEQHGWL